MMQNEEGTWHGVRMHVHFWDLYQDKHDGKTTGLSKDELPGTDMLAWAKMVTNDR